MDIRNVQRTGDMHYLYLPTSWCKEHKITSASKVMVTRGSGGSLILSPKLIEKTPKHLEISIQDEDQDIINKLIVACYINPTDSFKINLSKQIDYAKLLNQKRLISIELVEMHGKKITCESSVNVTDPDTLLKTMVNKLKNMLIVMTKNYNYELIERYEEEIDKTRLHIEKSVINSLTFNKESKLKAIELYYISSISTDIERMVDHILFLDAKETKFLESLLDNTTHLRDIVNIAVSDGKKFSIEDAMKFLKETRKIKEESIKDIKSYYRQRIKQYLTTIAEVLMDWAVTNKIET